MMMMMPDEQNLKLKYLESGFECELPVAAGVQRCIEELIARGRRQ